MRRLFISVLVICCMMLVGGCHSDAKQSAEIQTKMEDAVSYEEKFKKDYDHLKTYREQEQSIYHDIIKLDIQDDTDSLQQKSDDASDNVTKQKSLIDNARQHFQKAYEQVLTIEKNIEKIKDEDQKKQAANILKIMKERRDQLASFFDAYEEQLQRLRSFYNQLQQEDSPFRIEKLDKQIHDINDHNQDLENHIKTFNQKTQSYNETKEAYYKMTEVN